MNVFFRGAKAFGRTPAIWPEHRRRVTSLEGSLPAHHLHICVIYIICSISQYMSHNPKPFNILSTFWVKLKETTCCNDILCKNFNIVSIELCFTKAEEFFCYLGEETESSRNTTNLSAHKGETKELCWLSFVHLELFRVTLASKPKVDKVILRQAHS